MVVIWSTFFTSSKKVGNWSPCSGNREFLELVIASWQYLGMDVGGRTDRVRKCMYPIIYHAYSSSCSDVTWALTWDLLPWQQPYCEIYPQAHNLQAPSACTLLPRCCWQLPTIIPFTSTTPSLPKPPFYIVSHNGFTVRSPIYFFPLIFVLISCFLLFSFRGCFFFLLFSAGNGSPFSHLVSYCLV